MPTETSGADDELSRRLPEFSLVLGGPLYQLLRRAHIADDAMGMLWRRLVSISLFCWLPLFLLSAWDGRLSGAAVAVPFTMDIEVHVRFLAVVPLLIAAELVVHRRMRFLVAQFLERHLIEPAQFEQFGEAIDSAIRLRNSVLAEVALIVIVYGLGVFVIWRHYTSIEAESWLSTSTAGEPALSLAGLWFKYVSLPIFQFLLIRWYFRIFVWARFLWRVSLIDLNLIPTHPDRAGGLGFLSGAVYAYIPLLTAHGAMLAGLLASRIFFAGETLADFKLDVFVFVVFLLLVVQGPLLVFVPQLAHAKRVGLREFGALSSRYVRAFDAKWLRDGADAGEPVLGSADLQSLSDLNGAHEVVREMRVTLVTRSAIVTFAGAIVAPIAPLALTMMPMEELLSHLFGILF